VRNAAGSIVYLFELPGENPMAWLAPVMVKAPDEQVLNTVLDPRFDVRRAALFDTGATVSATTVSALPAPLSTKVTVRSYAPGKITLGLDAPAPAGSALIVSENYYPGWHATVNGREARVGRADYTLIGVELPVGAQTVELRFDSASYHTGKTITLVALVVAVVWWLAGAFADRRTRV
jgi:hypothetical protein